MKKNIKTLLSLCIAVALAGLLAQAAFAQSASSSATPVKERLNNANSMNQPLTPQAKGGKVWVVFDTNARRVLDEGSTSPTTGSLLSVEISSAPAGSSCYVNIYDSSVASDTTENGSRGRLLAPPLIAVTSQSSYREYFYPKQFHKGLVVIGVGTSASCNASVEWARNGGKD